MKAEHSPRQLQSQASNASEALDSAASPRARLEGAQEAGQTSAAARPAAESSDGITTIIDTTSTRQVGTSRDWQRLLGRVPKIAIDDRLSRILLSLVLSILLWFYVVNLENPAQTTAFRNVNLDVRGLGSNIRVTNATQIPQVDISVQAPQNLMSSLKQSNVRPFIDLTGLGEGVHDVPVRVQEAGIPAGSISTSVDPNSVQVQLEVQVTNAYTVGVQLNGTPAFGYNFEPPQSSPGTVSVTGSRNAVERVKSVVVSVDVDAKAATQQGLKTPVALDSSGKEVQGLTFNPPSVQVSVPIKLLLGNKSVPVRVPLIGQPAPGYRVSDITFDPTNVTVCCSPNVLGPLQFLEVQPVAITGTTSTVVTSTELILPQNVDLYPGQSRAISVTIAVEVLLSRIDLSVAPVVQNLPPGTTAVVSPARLDITLSGTFAQLQSIKPTDIQAYVDAQGRTSGTVDLPLQTIVPQGVKVERVSQDSVSITIIPPTPVPPTPIVPTATVFHEPTVTLAPSATATRVPGVVPTATAEISTPTHTPSPVAAATETTAPPTRTALPTATLPPTPTSTLQPLIPTPSQIATAIPLATPTATRPALGEQLQQPTP